MSEKSYPELEKTLSEEFDLTIVSDQAPLLDRLANKINDLILNDFAELVNRLYRIDVSERKLKATLKEYSGKDAGYLIAHLIIERQLQKIRMRNKNKNDRDADDDEKW